LCAEGSGALARGGSSPPAAQMICSPYDTEARYSQKRSTEWIGYRAHLTETCDEDLPYLITDVQTTPAPASGFNMLPKIQADLAARDVLPGEQMVDAGYVTPTIWCLARPCMA
jgi:transposase